jgi:hypothetical protein
MDSSFGVLDAFAFLVFAILIFVAVAIIVSLGKLPGQLARRWGHPQASAINAASWIGIATGGLLWPVAFIWAFIATPGSQPASVVDNRRGDASFDAVALRNAASREPLDDVKTRS